MKEHLTPAELVVSRFGGHRALAHITRASHTTSVRWCERGGNIPSKWHKLLLTAAKKDGISLTEYELIHGGHD